MARVFVWVMSGRRVEPQIWRDDTPAGAMRGGSDRPVQKPLLSVVIDDDDHRSIAKLAAAHPLPEVKST